MKPSDMTRDALTVNASELQRALEDAALYERLSKARGEVARLQKAGAELTATLNKQLAAEATAAKNEADAKFRTLSVTTSYPDATRTSGVLAAKFSISWEGLQWNSRRNENEPTSFRFDGFSSVPNEVYAYIMNIARTLSRRSSWT